MSKPKVTKVCAGNYTVTIAGVAGSFAVFRAFNGEELVWFTTSSECHGWSDTANTKREAIANLERWVNNDNKRETASC